MRLPGPIRVWWARRKLNRLLDEVGFPVEYRYIFSGDVRITEVRS